MTGLDRKKSAGMWGLLLADAAGVPYEFKSPSEIPEGVPKKTLRPPPDFPRSHPSVKNIVWSDDGAQALAVAASLYENKGKYRHKDIIQRLINWRLYGDYSADGIVFDIGNQTAHALAEWEHLFLTSGLREWHRYPASSNGNGSLMRTLPLALFASTRDSMGTLAAMADTMSTITHGHIYSRAACAMFAVAAVMVLNGYGERSFEMAEREMGHIDQELVRALNFKTPTIPTGSGFVLDSFSFARMAIRSGWSYVETVRRAIALGGDTDTTASIAGGIVALQQGEPKFPENWMSSLNDPRSTARQIIYGACNESPNDMYVVNVVRKKWGA